MARHEAKIAVWLKTHFPNWQQELERAIEDATRPLAEVREQLHQLGYTDADIDAFVKRATAK